MTVVIQVGSSSLTSRGTRVDRDKTTSDRKYIQWRFIYRKLYYSIRARRPLSSVSEHQRRHSLVLSRTACLLWLAA